MVSPGGSFSPWGENLQTAEFSVVGLESKNPVSECDKEKLFPHSPLNSWPHHCGKKQHRELVAESKHTLPPCQQASRSVLSKNVPILPHHIMLHLPGH